MGALLLTGWEADMITKRGAVLCRARRMRAKRGENILLAALSPELLKT